MSQQNLEAVIKNQSKVMCGICVEFSDGLYSSMLTLNKPLIL